MRSFEGNDEGAAFGNRVVLHADGETASVGYDPMRGEYDLLLGGCRYMLNHDGVLADPERDIPRIMRHVVGPLTHANLMAVLAGAGRDPATYWLLLQAGFVVAACERRGDHDLHKAAALELGRFGEVEEI